MFGIGKKHHKHDGTSRPERVAPMKVGFAPGAGALPAQVDLRPQLGPVEDVGSHTSTGAFVIAACIDRILARTGSTTGKISRAYLWYYGRVIAGVADKDASAAMTDYIAAELAHGHVRDADWPYTEENILQQPPQQVRDNSRIIQGFEWGQTLGRDAVKAALADGWPVAFRYSGPQDLFDEAGKTGKMAAWGTKPAPNIDDPPFSLTLLLVGYDDDAQVFVVRNCWADTWGDKGHFTMPYDTLANCCIQNNFFYIGTQETPKKALMGMSPGADGSSSSSSPDDAAQRMADMRANLRKEQQDDLEDAKKSARSRLRDAVDGGSKRMADRDTAATQARGAELTDVQKQIDADRAAADERRRATMAGPGKAAPAADQPQRNDDNGGNGGGGNDNGAQ